MTKENNLGRDIRTIVIVSARDFDSKKMKRKSFTKITSLLALILIFLIFRYTSAQVDSAKLYNKSMQTTEEEIIAIDILLDPDQTLMKSAKVYNDLMRVNYDGPGSYSLDAIHTPHITVFQCFVKTYDLEKVYGAVEKVVVSEQPTKGEITTSGFYYLPYDGLGLAGITATPTGKLLSFQTKIIEALKPFMVVGTNEAFVPNADGTPIAAGTDEYVNGFIPDHSGAKFNPHVTIGLAHEDFLKELLSKPYSKITFKSKSVSIYQLGDFGTAQKKLWTSAK